jgi:Family of unknown function (DUF5330)
MFLIRAAFWIGLVVLLLPTDANQQARLYDTAAATLERVTTFCDRNARTCEVGSEVWAAFLKKAEFGARMAFELITSRGAGKDEDGVPIEPASAKGKAEKKPQPASRGTLTPTDLNPPWRGQPQRQGA